METLRAAGCTMLVMEGERLMVQHLRQLRIIQLMLTFVEHQCAEEDEDDGDDNVKLMVPSSSHPV